MSNNEDINIGDILPPKKDVAEKFQTAETKVPEFLKEAAYSADETREQTIKRDWERLTQGLSDYVLAEQLTEYELRGMGKPVAENYSMYFTTTLAEVQKNRKKAEQRLFKFIPAHSQLDSKAFFEVVHEQNEKEKEARLRSIELYPKAGVAKLDYADDARKGLKKEAAAWCQTCGKDAKPGDPSHDNHTVLSLPADPDPKEEAAKRQKKMDKKEASCNGETDDSTPNQCVPRVNASADSNWTATDAQSPATNYEEAPCSACTNPVAKGTGIKVLDKLFCGECHDSGNSIPAAATSPAKPTDLPPTSTSTGPLMKEAASKWNPGTELEAKHNGAKACVAYVNEEDKTYVIKVDGTMYPSYYSYEDAHETFNKSPDAKPSVAAKERMEGLAG